MPIPSYLKPVYEAVMTAPTTWPLPWQRIGTIAVGGLTDVGFIGDSDDLLVLSSQGRGIYNCSAGDRLARDRDERYEFDVPKLRAAAFGPYEGHVVHTSGLHGGGLALTTSDGWLLESFVFDWPVQVITLAPVGRSAYSVRQGKPCEVYKIAEALGIFAFGFSPTGRSFIIATSSDLQIVARP